MFVSDTLTDFGSRGGAFNINGVKVPGVTFLHCNPVFVGVPLRRVEDIVFLYFVVLNFVPENPPAWACCQMFFSLRNLRGELLLFTICHRSNWDEVILCVGVGPVVAKSV